MTTEAVGKIFHRPNDSKGEFTHSSGNMGQTSGWFGYHFERSGNRKSPACEVVWSSLPGTNSLSDAQNMSDWRNADYGKKFLQDHNNENSPFFLGVGIFHPHSPWYAPQAFYDGIEKNIANIALPPYLWNDGEDTAFFTGKRLTEAHSCYIEGDYPGVCPGSTKDNIKQCMQWKEAVRAYLASVYFADYAVGHILDALENSKFKENTIIVLAGDHGWSLGEKTTLPKRQILKLITALHLSFMILQFIRTAEIELIRLFHYKISTLLCWSLQLNQNPAFI